MALKKEDLLEIEKSLKESNEMDAEDVIEEEVAGDYYTLMGQIRGHYYFTKERVIFISGMGIDRLSIKYSDIRAIKKSFVGPFLPFGITITADNQEKGKTKKYKFSLTKRTYWIELLSKKSGISCA